MHYYIFLWEELLQPLKKKKRKEIIDIFLLFCWSAFQKYYFFGNCKSAVQNSLNVIGLFSKLDRHNPFVGI